MAQRRKTRQITPTTPIAPITTATFTLTPTEALNPIIPTEVFVELNPELVQFYEKQYAPENYANYQGYKFQSWSCFPRVFCMPRPCTPI